MTLDASVIIPSRNRSVLLQDTLRDVASQDVSPDRFEVILVDDGSTDETPGVCSAFIESCAMEAGYVRLEQSGLNAARNRGIERARAALVVFLDDDVALPTDWLTEMLAGAARNPSAGCFGGPIKLRLEGKAPRMCPADRVAETELDLGPSEKETDHAYGANFAVTKQAIELAGSFDETLPLYGEEQEWQARLIAAGGSIVYLPRAWVWHRRSAGDLRVTRLAKGQFRRGRARWVVAPKLGRQRRPLRKVLSLVLHHLRHAVARRCWGGFFKASFWAGYAVEVLRSRSAGAGT